MSKIIELSQKLQDKKNIENDFREAFALVQNMFYKKYLNHIEAEVNSYMKKVNKPKEVQLIQAFKAFVPDEQSEMLDKISDSYVLMNTLTNMQSELNKSIHEDGVYDIDEECINATKKNVNMLLLFSAWYNQFR